MSAVVQIKNQTRPELIEKFVLYRSLGEQDVFYPEYKVAELLPGATHWEDTSFVMGNTHVYGIETVLKNGEKLRSIARTVVWTEVSGYGSNNLKFGDESYGLLDYIDAQELPLCSHFANSLVRRATASEYETVIFNVDTTLMKVLFKGKVLFVPVGPALMRGTANHQYIANSLYNLVKPANPFIFKVGDEYYRARYPTTLELKAFILQQFSMSALAEYPMYFAVGNRGDLYNETQTISDALLYVEDVAPSTVTVMTMTCTRQNMHTGDRQPWTKSTYTSALGSSVRGEFPIVFEPHNFIEI